eukprot:scpid59838/ scgid26553/ 
MEDSNDGETVPTTPSATASCELCGGKQPTTCTNCLRIQISTVQRATDTFCSSVNDLKQQLIEKRSKQSEANGSQGIFVNQARIDMKNDYLVKELAMHKVFTCLRSLMMNQEKIFHMQLRKNFATGQKELTDMLTKRMERVKRFEQHAQLCDVILQTSETDMLNLLARKEELLAPILETCQQEVLPAQVISAEECCMDGPFSYADMMDLFREGIKALVTKCPLSMDALWVPPAGEDAHILCKMEPESNNAGSGRHSSSSVSSVSGNANRGVASTCSSVNPSSTSTAQFTTSSATGDQQYSADPNTDASDDQIMKTVHAADADTGKDTCDHNDTSTVSRNTDADGRPAASDNDVAQDPATAGAAPKTASSAASPALAVAAATSQALSVAQPVRSASSSPGMLLTVATAAPRQVTPAIAAAAAAAAAATSEAAATASTAAMAAAAAASAMPDVSMVSTAAAVSATTATTTQHSRVTSAKRDGAAAASRPMRPPPALKPTCSMRIPYTQSPPLNVSSPSRACTTVPEPVASDQHTILSTQQLAESSGIPEAQPMDTTIDYEQATEPNNDHDMVENVDGDHTPQPLEQQMKSGGSVCLAESCCHSPVSALGATTRTSTPAAAASPLPLPAESTSITVPTTAKSETAAAAAAVGDMPVLQTLLEVRARIASAGQEREALHIAVTSALKSEQDRTTQLMRLREVTRQQTGSRPPLTRTPSTNVDVNTVNHDAAAPGPGVASMVTTNAGPAPAAVSSKLNNSVSTPAAMAAAATAAVSRPGAISDRHALKLLQEQVRCGKKLTPQQQQLAIVMQQRLKKLQQDGQSPPVQQVNQLKYQQWLQRKMQHPLLQQQQQQ